MMDTNMRQYLRQLFGHSMTICLVMKMMVHLVTNVESTDHSYEVVMRGHQTNDNYFEYFVTRDDYNGMNYAIDGSDRQLPDVYYDSDEDSRDIHNRRHRKRSNDVSIGGDNQLMPSSSATRKADNDPLTPVVTKHMMTNESSAAERTPYHVDCNGLRLGQYRCHKLDVDPETQQPRTCNKKNKAYVNCTLTSGLVCEDTGSENFSMPVDCRHTNGYSYETALLLSIFLGMFGADRFYLGYPALGLLKFCTLGFLFLGQLVDIILIALQIVGPADGSHYVIKYFGPKLDIVSFNENTDIIYENNWYMN